MNSPRRYDRLRREELKMKKSIAVILLGSALLLPNNNSVEASYSDTNVQLKKAKYIECVGWEDRLGYFSNLKLEKTIQHKFHYDWKDFLNKYLEVAKPAPSKPIEGADKKPTPEVENKPEVEVVPDTKPIPTPTPESTPEKPDTSEKQQDEQTQETPEVEEVPEKPEVEQTPETPEIEQVPETKPVPEVVPTPPTPVEPTPEESNKPVEESPNASISGIEQAVLSLTNAERQKAGLAPLQSDSKLMDSARAKSKDMATKNYFSHTSPTYGSPFDQMKSFGISYRSAAENIAMGQRSAEEVVKAWMESPGHRQNILGANFTHIGIGYDASGHYWTQQFIQK